MDSLDAIKSVYRRESKKYHPDNLATANAEKFKSIVEAWKEIQQVHGTRNSSIWSHNTIFTIKRRNI